MTRLRLQDAIRRSVTRASARVISTLVPRQVMASKQAFDIWERRGYHIVRSHFYEPIPDLRRLPESAWEGYDAVDMNEEGQLALAARARGYDILGLEGRHGFTFQNTFFSGADAASLYTIIREYKTRRVMEIGSGWSTRVALAALEDNGSRDLVTVEPYEAHRMPHPPTYPVPVQEVPLSAFDALAANDILFIDSSHVIGIGSDVTHLVLRVLPRLRPGVIVHFHDVFLPEEYPRPWVTDLKLFWTEQYLVHAFLLFNDSFEILWSTHFFRTRHPEIHDRWPRVESTTSYGGSLWIRRLLHA